MLPVYPPWGGSETYQRGVSSHDQLFLGENGKNKLSFLGGFLQGVNALSHQCIDEKR